MCTILLQLKIFLDGIISVQKTCTKCEQFPFTNITRVLTTAQKLWKGSKNGSTLFITRVKKSSRASSLKGLNLRRTPVWFPSTTRSSVIISDWKVNVWFWTSLWQISTHVFEQQFCLRHLFTCLSRSIGHYWIVCGITCWTLVNAVKGNSCCIA